MPDEADEAQAVEETLREALIRQTARDIPPGTPGDCDLCGEWCGRLIGGACAPCRDHFKLP
jgi:hypothetical protein